MNICNFTAADIMQSKIVTVNPKQRLLDVKKIFEKKEFHHHIPVVENQKPVGIISMVDFLHAIGEAGLSDEEDIYQNMTVKDIMRPRPVSVQVSTGICEIISLLAKGEIHSVLINDKDGLAGIVTSTDLLRLLLTLCNGHDTNQQSK